MAVQLYEQLLGNLLQIAVQPTSRPFAWSAPPLSPFMVRRLGFDDDQALLAADAHLPVIRVGCAAPLAEYRHWITPPEQGAKNGKRASGLRNNNCGCCRPLRPLW